MLPGAWSHRLIWLAVALVAVCAPGRARAAERRAVALEVDPEAGWRGEALAAVLAHDLVDDWLTVHPPLPCAGRCSDGELRTAGAELVVRAALSSGRIDYELHALWPGGPAPQRGAIALGAAGARDRAQVVGVLRDRLHRMARATADEDARAAAAVALPAPADVALALAAVIAVLVLPLGYGALRRSRLVALRALGRTLLGVGGAGGIALAVAALAPANPSGILLAAGRVAWGVFAAVTLPVVFPPLVGLGLVEHDELARTLFRWCGLVMQRAVALALWYAPPALAVALLADGQGDPARDQAVDQAVRWGVVLPLALLVARAWLRIAIAVVAESLDDALLDDALLDPDADAAAWHAAVRAYVVGYLRRNGLTSIDEDLLDRVVFLPSRGDALAVYGGGATAARIAIPRRMLELALAPFGRPHDYAAPRVSTLHWLEWNAGLVMASEPGAQVTTRDQRKPSGAVVLGEDIASAREPLGEPPTLAGIVEPAALDPRANHRPHDDPAWLDWDAGEDYDGTDAGDRDFLFGVLVHVLTQIQRHGDRSGTIAVALGRARFAAPIARRLGRWLDRMPDAVGHEHVALAGARHHFVQYLGWRVWQRDDLLTSRAYQAELEAMSRRVLAALDEAPGPATRERARLGRLAGLVRGTAPRSARWRRLAIAVVVVAGVGGLGHAAISAIRYHATYVDRMTDSSEKVHGKDE